MEYRASFAQRRSRLLSLSQYPPRRGVDCFPTSAAPTSKRQARVYLRGTAGAARGAEGSAASPDQVRSRRTAHVSHLGMPVSASRALARTATIGIALGAVSALVVGASPIAVAQTAAPKAYVGLFGDNAIAVLDTAKDQVTKTIPIPKGPHGLVITPD